MGTSLYIEKGDDVQLPEKYHEIHNICVIIYDQLTEIFKKDCYNELTQTEIKLEENYKLIEEFRTHKIDVFSWLKLNNMNNEIVNVQTKNLIHSIVLDFSNFMFESMNCAKKGKMTLAYALLRKPITDELLIFEQLLVDKAEFINRYYHEGTPANYDPSHKSVKKKEIIHKANEKLRFSVFGSSDFIYDLRYNKSCKYGLNGITNQALHIVTLDKHYKTQEKSLNFVFSDEENLNKYYKHYYNLVPYLLFYSVSIIDELIFSILSDKHNKNQKILKELKRLIGFLLFIEQISVKKREKYNNTFTEVFKEISLTCNCGNVNKIEKADCKLFLETEMLLCTKCFSNLLEKQESIEIIDKYFSEIRR